MRDDEPGRLSPHLESQDCLMHEHFIAATRLPLQTLMMIGAVGGAVLIMFSFANWRRAVKLALVIALFEGAIRKWVFPSGQELVYFLKDVFLLGAYLKFFFFPDPQTRAWRTNVPVGGILLLVAIVSFSALNPNIGSVILAGYGVKIYFFYLPLAFMIPHLFKSEDDMIKQVCNYAFLATPICLLGIAQFGAGQDSWINCYAEQSTIAGENISSFGWGGSKTRITGTFSYISGHATFVLFMGAVHLALLACNLPKWRWVWLVINIPLILGNAFMNGSRGNILGLGLVFGVFIMASSLMKVGQKKNIVATLVLGGLVSLGGISIYFAEALQEWTTRWQSASDGMRFRVIEHQVNSLGKAMEEAGAFGYGIGMAHPAPNRLRQVLGIRPPKRKAPVFDSEPGQIYGELGPAGFASWMILRVLLVIHAFQSIFLCRSARLKALLVVAFTLQLITMWFGSVYNHTAHIFVFTLYGFALIPYTVQRFSPGRRGSGVPASPSPSGEYAASPARAYGRS